jgi:hypothetical protein
MTMALLGKQLEFFLDENEMLNDTHQPELK